MPKRLYDFRCTNDHITEKFTDLAEGHTYRCNECGAEAKRVISPVHFKLEGVTGHFPTAADQWAKRRKEQIALERKREANQ
jgi:putative FmdB family regulatory protein